MQNTETQCEFNETDRDRIKMNDDDEIKWNEPKITEKQSEEIEWKEWNTKKTLGKKTHKTNQI